MTIYTLSVITNTGFPYFHTKIKELPKGIKLFLRFFDFTEDKDQPQMDQDSDSTFALNSGLISALFEFARSMDKKIRSLVFKSRTDENKMIITGESPLNSGDVLSTFRFRPRKVIWPFSYKTQLSKLYIKEKNTSSCLRHPY